MAEWLECQALNRENPGSNHYCHFEALAISFNPHCHSSLSHINEYLATDRGGHVNEWSSFSNYNVAECFLEKSKVVLE